MTGWSSKALDVGNMGGSMYRYAVDYVGCRGVTVCSVHKHESPSESVQQHVCATEDC